MNGVFSKPNLNREIDAHVWIGAFALAQVVIALVFLNKINLLIDTMGVTAIAQQKAAGEVASLQREILDLRQALAARADSSKKAGHDAADRADHVDAPLHGRARN